MINAYWQALTFVVQEGEPQEWFRVVDTSLPSPRDICEPETEPKLPSLNYRVGPRSTVVLVRK
jgi:glycogen operon protein